MSIKASTLVIGLVLDRRVEVIYLEETNPQSIGDNFLECISSRTSNRALVVIYSTTAPANGHSNVSYVGIHAPALGIKTLILAGSELGEDLPYKNIYTKVSDKCNAFHSMLSTCLESGNYERMLSNRMINKSSESVYRELCLSGLLDNYLVISYDDKDIVAVETDLGPVGFLDGKFMLFG